MPGIVIVGTQWGDEAKGKITDFLAGKADRVVRYNGGANAGHTVVVEGKKYKFRVVPSGILHGKRVYIGNGVVLDPEVLLQELNDLRKAGLKPDLGVSGRAHVTFEFHRVLDGLQEKVKGNLKAGTTKRGIGPTYADKAARFGIRVADLLDDDALHTRLDLLLNLSQKLITNVYGGNQVLDRNEVFREAQEFGRDLAPMVCDVSADVNEALDRNETVIFEGAQGTLLDIDHGLYPYGSSSNSSVGGACTGVGVGPTRISKVVGVVKAYTSRVGEGPVPTELTDKVGNEMRRAGHEFGTVTGRPRRCGWLDLVPVKYSVMLNGVTDLAVTKLDVLSGIDPLKICVGYDADGEEVDTIPASLSLFEKCKPVYEELKGWRKMVDWQSVVAKGYDALPTQTRVYLERIEEIIGVPISIVSVGPERRETIIIS